MTPVDLSMVTVGVLEEFQVDEESQRSREVQQKVIDTLRSFGANVKVVSIPLTKYALPYHYSLVPSEAASNLSRYDGLRYGS